MSKNSLTFFSREKLFFPLDGKIAVSAIPPQNIWREAIFLQLIVRKWKENHEMFFKFIVLKMFLWTCGMQFRQSLQKYRARRSGNFVSLSIIDMKFSLVPNINFFSDMFLGTRRVQFQQYLKMLRQKAEKVCSFSKNDRRSRICLKGFSQNCFYGQMDWMHFDKPDENHQQKGEKLTLIVQKRRRKYNLISSFFLRSVLMVTLNAILLTRSEQVAWKAETITVDVR